MDPKFLKSHKVPAPDALRLEHDEMRAGLVHAALEEGAIGNAARRVARLCRPHFDQEEKLVFPVFEQLHGLALGDVQPETAAVLPLISRFSAWHNSLRGEHRSIVSALGALLTTAHRERNREIAHVAHQLWMHERMEEAVIYPAVILMGNYVQEKLQVRAAGRKSPRRAGSAKSASYALN